MLCIITNYARITSFWFVVCRDGSRDQLELLTNNLPVTYQLLGSQNLEPVTKQAPETQPFSKFRNPQLVVNPCLAVQVRTDGNAWTDGVVRGVATRGY